MPVYFHGSTNVSVNGLRLHGSLKAGLIARDCRDLAITGSSIESARESGFVLDGVTGGEITGNAFLDVQSKGDANSGAIDVVNSRDLKGERNRVERSRIWKGTSYGPLRVSSSPSVTIAVSIYIE
jgi:polygalacturonase